MKGWIQESKRHSLARQGVRTGKKVTSLHHEAGDRTLHPRIISKYEREANLIDKIINLLNDDDTRGTIQTSYDLIYCNYTIHDETDESVSAMKVLDDKWVIFTVDNDDLKNGEFYFENNKKLYTKVEVLQLIKDQIQSYHEEKVE